MKTANEGGQRASELGNTPTAQDGGAPHTLWGRGHPVYLSIWLFICVLADKGLIVGKVFPEFLSHSSKFLKLRRGPWEPAVCGQVRQKWG